MDPTDRELYRMLLDQLAEAGSVEEDPDAGVITLRDMPAQRAPWVRVHLTPDELGRCLRDLAPTCSRQFPLLAPLEAALAVFFLRVLDAVQKAGPDGGVLELCSERRVSRPAPTPTPRRRPRARGHRGPGRHPSG